MAWDRRALEADQLREQGEFERAEERYRQLRDSAESARDRRDARLQLARIAAQQGHVEEALETYKALGAKSPHDDVIRARALWEASTLIEETRNVPERVRTLRTTLVRRYPGSTWAETAVDALTAEARERHSPEALRSLVSTLHPDIEDTPVADYLHFEVARELETIDASDDARKLYQRQLRRYPDGSKADDAEWRLAQIHLADQRWPDAIELLRRVAERVQISWFAGTYTSPWASPARYRLGFLYLTHLSDYERAIAHFRQHLSDFDGNRLTDDAAWGIVESHRLAGHQQQYRTGLREFVETYPESRYTREARERLE